jgi:hypothetical protein
MASDTKKRLQVMILEAASILGFLGASEGI